MTAQSPWFGPCPFSYKPALFHRWQEHNLRTHGLLCVKLELDTGLEAALVLGLPEAECPSS
jgi:hypothetical protein